MARAAGHGLVARGEGDQEHRQLSSDTQRPGGHRRRADLHRDGFRPHSAPTIRTTARSSGNGKSSPIPTGFRPSMKSNGRQYVAFYAGNGRSYNGIAWNAGKPEAQGYYVFALPEDVRRLSASARRAGAVAQRRQLVYTAWSDYGGSPTTCSTPRSSRSTRSNVGQTRTRLDVPRPRHERPLRLQSAGRRTGRCMCSGRTTRSSRSTPPPANRSGAHPVEGRPTDRGINYWQSKDGADRRLIFSVGQLPAGDQRAHRRHHQHLRQRWPRRSARSASRDRRAARPAPPDASSRI